MVTTKEEALKLTVPKLKEELTARGLSHDGLKVGFSFALQVWRRVAMSFRYPPPGLVGNPEEHSGGSVRRLALRCCGNLQMHQTKYGAADSLTRKRARST